MEEAQTKSPPCLTATESRQKEKMIGFSEKSEKFCLFTEDSQGTEM